MGGEEDLVLLVLVGVDVGWVWLWVWWVLWLGRSRGE